jgi:hypothetical protein
VCGFPGKRQIQLSVCASVSFHSGWIESAAVSGSSAKSGAAVVFAAPRRGQSARIIRPGRLRTAVSNTPVTVRPFHWPRKYPATTETPHTTRTINTCSGVSHGVIAAHLPIAYKTRKKRQRCTK